MMKRVLFLTLIIGFTSCASRDWHYFFPYTRVNPEKFYLNLPNNFEDCLNQFDTILSTTVINYYKNLDSSIAAIEISQEIGGLFINFWNLKLYTGNYDGSGFVSAGGGTTFYSKRYKCKPAVVDNFISKGMTDPEAMMRVLFSCYHKRLNSKTYDWDFEINRINSYWIAAKYGEGDLSPEMGKRENKILVDYHFNQLSPQDTVDILYNRPPELFGRSPDWYYLTGIIEFKISENKSINVKLLDIKSERGQNYMLTGNDTISIGDTLTDSCKGWLRRGTYYLDYIRNQEYRSGFN